MIKSGADSATVEALFAIPAEKKPLLEQIAAKGVETDGNLIIKRILTQHGRSRYYINGSLATARLAGELSHNLITVAGQRDHQQLLIPSRHLDFIDTVGNLWEDRLQFTDLFRQWTELKKQQTILQNQEAE